MRRRRKKKRSQERDETDDSGYFNGPDSSTETSSDEGRAHSGDLGVTLKLGEKKEEDGGDEDQAETGVVNIEFGDVQEILDELSRETTNQSEPELKAESELGDERREMTGELAVSQEETRETEEQSSLKREEPQTKKKSKSNSKKRTKITTSHNNESKESSLLSGYLFDSNWKTNYKCTFTFTIQLVLRLRMLGKYYNSI